MAMLNFKKILFPVDFSDRCRGAAHYVSALAGRFRSKVILLHVAESPFGEPGDIEFGALASSVYWEDRAARTRQFLDNFLAEELAHIDAERRVETGDAARTIVEIAEKESVDLIMMPTHGYGGFRRFILGSVTAKVLHDAGCPVWTGVHLEDAPPLERIEVRSIGCAVDLTETTTPAVASAARLAEDYGAKLTLIHAIPGSTAFPDKQLDSELRHNLAETARSQMETMRAAAGLPAEICIQAGDTHRVVAACAASAKADLLVVGRGRHGGLGRLRTHAYAIIRESPCPVISI